ncbi:aminopeptidase P family protein [Candidatus Woesearchaeota archaeon]|nr:MAG: aminopeptidase P family protein [Candidatus Woesearchaeota archaeon]
MLTSFFKTASQKKAVLNPKKSLLVTSERRDSLNPPSKKTPVYNPDLSPMPLSTKTPAILRRASKNTNRLVIGSTETNTDLLYLAKTPIPSRALLLHTRQRTYLAVPRLEFERVKKSAPNNIRVLCTDDVSPSPEPLETTALRLLQRLRIRSVTIQHDAPAMVYLTLANAHVRVGLARHLFPERSKKNREEIAAMRHAGKAARQAIQNATRTIANAKIRRGVLQLKGSTLTSEDIKRNIRSTLFSLGCYATSIIVSCGSDTSHPHHEGSGPLKPNEPIIIDVYPRHSKTKYWADTTRTVVYGTPSPQLVAMHRAVLRAYQQGVAMLKPGTPTRAIDAAVRTVLEQEGFATSKTQGFIHSTGHGVGLDLHEAPFISPRSNERLSEGNVVTVEPGLYYHASGGVRIENTFLVTKNGAVNLTNTPTTLQRLPGNTLASKTF